MAIQKTVKIDFDRIITMGMISNQKRKVPLSTYYNDFKRKYPNKEIYIMNGAIYNMGTNWTACLGLKVEGVVMANDWSCPFIGMNKNTMTFCAPWSNVNVFRDAVSAFPALLENGKKSKYFSHCIDNRNRGRTMLGYNNKEVILSVIEDTSGNSDFTLDEEVNYMQRMGCTYAINLDGGGSSQCNFNGEKIISSRKVHNLFYVVAEPKRFNNKNNNLKYNDLVVGQTITLRKDATYTSGKKIPNWVINSTLYIRQKKDGNKIVFSTQKSGAITGVVYLTQIEKVNG